MDDIFRIYIKLQLQKLGTKSIMRMCNAYTHIHVTRCKWHIVTFLYANCTSKTFYKINNMRLENKSIISLVKMLLGCAWQFPHKHRIPLLFSVSCVKGTTLESVGCTDTVFLVARSKTKLRSVFGLRRGPDIIIIIIITLFTCDMYGDAPFSLPIKKMGRIIDGRRTLGH